LGGGGKIQSSILKLLNFTLRIAAWSLKHTRSLDLVT
jgi:hypothetical protein